MVHLVFVLSGISRPLTSVALVTCLVSLMVNVAASKEAVTHLPAEEIGAAVTRAHAKFLEVKDGKNADYIPELATVPSDLFGVAIVTAAGEMYTAGDVDYVFSIQSVSKPFTAALVMQQQGANTIVDKIGVEPTGLPFNSVMALELYQARSVNPLVNAGAMAAVSLVQADNAQERFDKILGFYNRLAGEKLSVLDDIYQSEAATNQRNRAIANLLFVRERIYSDPMETVDVYTRQCAVGVTAKQLAVMGATLANGGMNPISREQVLDRALVPKVLAVMMTAGFYDESGKWAWDAGLPAKTGVGGGIVAVVPGRMAIAAFSPRLNEAGNSVRAALAIQYLADSLSLSLFGSGH